MLPALNGKHIFEDRPTAFCIKKLTFGTESVVLGGSLVAHWCFVDVGRDPWDTQKTLGFTVRFAFGAVGNGPKPPTYPPHPPTYPQRPPTLGFLVHFSATCNIFSSFFKQMLPALGGKHIFE